MDMLIRLILASTLTFTSLFALAEESFPTVMVYKSPTCGCCTEMGQASGREWLQNHQPQCSKYG